MGAIPSDAEYLWIQGWWRWGQQGPSILFRARGPVCVRKVPNLSDRALGMRNGIAKTSTSLPPGYELKPIIAKFGVCSFRHHSTGRCDSEPGTVRTARGTVERFEGMGVFSPKDLSSDRDQSALTRICHRHVGLVPMLPPCGRSGHRLYALDSSRCASHRPGTRA